MPSGHRPYNMINYCVKMYKLVITALCLSFIFFYFQKYVHFYIIYLSHKMMKMINYLHNALYSDVNPDEFLCYITDYKNGIYRSSNKHKLIYYCVCYARCSNDCITFNIYFIIRNTKMLASSGICQNLSYNKNLLLQSQVDHTKKTIYACQCDTEC